MIDNEQDDPLEKALGYLEKVIVCMLDELKYFSNGCGCCSTKSAKDTEAYREVAKLFGYDPDANPENGVVVHSENPTES